MPAVGGSTVFVAVPVYRGTAFVAETLRSILDQTHRDLRVRISVDGDDQASAEACAPFTTDDRVSIVVQDHSLGWAGNTNRLIEACDGDFYCYWQQDDLCEPTYLEQLVAALRSHPGAACAYSDVRWFGRTQEVASMPSVVGTTWERILVVLESLHWIPLRALVPADVLRRVGPVRGIDGDTFFADSLWSLRLAAEGDLVRVPEILYHKRDHSESASHARDRSTPFTAPEAWSRLGTRIFEEMAPYVGEEDRGALAVAIADRLVMHRPGRWFQHDPLAESVTEAAAFVVTLFRRLEEVSGLTLPALDAGDRSERALVALRARRDEAPPGSVLRLVAEGSLAGPERRRLLRSATEPGGITVDGSEDGPTTALFVRGWSQPEAWGTWTDGHRARLWVPVPADGASWRLRLEVQPYLGSPDAPVAPRIVVRDGDVVVLDHRATEGGPLPTFDLVADGQGATPGEGMIIELELPDAVSPSALGLGPDERQLSLGLVSVAVQRVAATR